MGLQKAHHKCNRISHAHTGTCQFEVRLDHTDRLMQPLIPDLDRHCVCGGRGGPSSNEAALLDHEGPEQEMCEADVRIANIRSYCSTAFLPLSHSQMQTSRVSSSNPKYQNADDTSAHRRFCSTNEAHQLAAMSCAAPTLAELAALDDRCEVAILSRRVGVGYTKR